MTNGKTVLGCSVRSQCEGPRHEPRTLDLAPCASQRICSVTQGALFVFTKNMSQGVGAVTNALCVGRRIDLDPREPEDDLSRPYRVLRYPPLAVWVEPMESPVPVGNGCGPMGPPNCIPIVLERQKGKCIFKTQVFVDGIWEASWDGHRTAFPLGDGYCVTDYYAQGQSFREHPWFAHLGMPDGGNLLRPSVLVTLTRFRDWDAVRPWARLWRDDDAAGRDKVIDAFYKQARPSPDLEKELERLEAAEARTIVALAQQGNYIRDLLA